MTRRPTPGYSDKDAERSAKEREATGSSISIFANLRAASRTLGQNTAGSPPPERASAPRDGAVTKQIRGSSLLVFGRLIALVINFAAQVIVIRHLSKSDYGALAYGQTIAAALQSVVVFGLSDTIARYVPMYREQQAYGKMYGTIIVAVTTVLLLSVPVVAAALQFPGIATSVMVQDAREQAPAILLMLVFLVPLEGLGMLLNNLFAIFAEPSAIFWRRAVLTPGIKLVAVGMVAFSGASVTAFAAGFFAASAVTLVLYTAYLLNHLRRTGALQHVRFRTLEYPVRELFGFALPLLTSTAIWLMMEYGNTMMLGWFGGAAEVAAYQAVLPLARTNQFVLMSSSVLFMPAAATLYARGEYERIGDLYRKTALWTALLSFPVFAMTFNFARPLTQQLYGERYTDSAYVLAALAIGYFFQAATGFNGLTLQLFKKQRFSVAADMVTAALTIALSLLLIPRYGAIGAAISTAATSILCNVLRQIGLHALVGIRIIRGQYLAMYAAMALAAVCLWVCGWLLHAPLVVAARSPGLSRWCCCVVVAM
ncbi:MAG: flippase [Blastochloris sp.]|nr:flippase [Blastochloris sp.]